MTSDSRATPAGSARADGPWAERVGDRCYPGHNARGAGPARAGAAAPVARSRS